VGCNPANVFNPEIVADRIRRGLDVIGNIEGSLLYRGPDYWEVLLPGTEGQVLIVNAGGLPEWGAAPGPSFEYWFDDFNVANEVGLHYLGVGTTAASAIISSGRFRFNGGGGSAQKCCYIPKEVVGLNLKSQYSRALWANDNGSGAGPTRVFVGCCMRGQVSNQAITNGIQGYVFQMLNDGSPRWLVQKVTGLNTGTNLAIGTPMPAVGSVIEIHCELNASSVDIEVFDDGVSIWSGTDSSSPLLYGLPGLGTSMNAPGTVQSGFDWLECGLLV